MSELALFPRKPNLLKGIALSLGILFIAVAMGLSGDLMAVRVIALVIGLIGAALLVSCVSRLRRPRPVFAADAGGFRVMGGKTRGWDRFQGVQMRSVRVGMFPRIEWIAIRVGKSRRFARFIHIKWVHLSEPAPDMAQAITEFAAMAKAGRLDTVEKTRPPEDGTKTVPPFDIVIQERKKRADRKVA